MKISKEQLVKQSNLLGFRAEILEKVWHLMGILNEINKHPYLENRLVLKGGTALNLFLVNLPRLSIDIDLNYIGNISRELMHQERPIVEESLRAICANQGFEMRRGPNAENQGAHAGGKFQFRYDSVFGNKGNLHIDVSYMYRTTLWQTQKRKSVPVAGLQTNEVLILSPEEIIAGKLSALFTRKASRDLFDVHHLLHNMPIDYKKLKTSFLIYGIMSPKDLRNISTDLVKFDKDEYYQNLVPVIKRENFIKPKFFNNWAEKIENECQKVLNDFIVFSPNEKLFLDQFYTNGELNLKLITEDESLGNQLERHPLLLWRKYQLKLSDKSEDSSIGLKA